MAFYSIDVYPGDGATKTFALTFEFISRDSVFVYSVDDTTKAETALTVVTSGNPSSGQYKWDSDKQITLGDALPTGTSVKIQRDTTIDLQIVQWKDGSYIIAEDLNTSDKQWLYNLQELEDHIDQLNGSSSGAAVKKITGTAPVEVDSTNAQEPNISVDETVSTDNPNALTSDTRLMSEKAIDSAFSQAVGASGVYPPAGVTAKTGKLRIDDTGAEPKQFYWNGTAWVQIPTKGDKGDQGIQGPAGPPPGIQSPSATATNVPLQSNNVLGQAYASVSADSSGDLKFNFGIPVGQKGDKGDVGDGVNYLGEIDATTAPQPTDSKNGDFYVNTTAGTSSWTGLSTVGINERLIYNGHTNEWDSYASTDLWQESGDQLYPRNANADVLIGGVLPGAPIITLNADGVIRFANSELGQYGDQTFSLKNTNNAPIDFFTNNTQRMRLNNVGDVLIGGTLPLAPNIALYGNGVITTKNSYSAGSNTKVFIQRNNAGTETLSWTNDGSATFAGNVKVGVNSNYVNVKADGGISAIDQTNNQFVWINNITPGAIIINDVNSSTNGKIVLNADGTSAFENKARITYANSTVYSPTSGAKESGSLLLTNNDNTSVNGLSAGLRMVATGSGNNASAYIGMVNTDSDGNAAIVFCPRTNSPDSGAPSAGEAERVRISSSGNILIGGTLPSAPNIQLNADGKVLANRFETTGGFNPGFIHKAASGAGSGNNVFAVQDERCILGTSADINADPNIELNVDGSGVFKGYLNVNDSAGSPSGTNNGAQLQPNGLLKLSNAGANVIVQGFKTGTTDPTVQIRADGSATFGGTGLVDISNPAYLNGAQIGSRIRFLNTNGDPAANAETWATITVNGSPGFAQAGPLLFQVKNSATDGTQKTIAGVSTFGFNVYDPNAPYVGNDFNVKILLGTDGNIAADNVTFKLEPDDDSNYTTTTEEYTETETYEGPRGRTLEREVTKTREVKTYTGPTMDVKDTLLKITEALTQLKTAAASATTCEELRTAIDTALADV